jgi:ABC-type bacteriocin/lantibiotic exporter with double-glycine peptidase domain
MQLYIKAHSNIPVKLYISKMMKISLAVVACLLLVGFAYGFPYKTAVDDEVYDDWNIQDDTNTESFNGFFSLQVMKKFKKMRETCCLTNNMAKYCNRIMFRCRTEDE